MDFLHDDYKIFLKLLNKEKVRYLLIGGLAVNIYGYKRMTEDMDILFQATHENNTRLLKAIEELGFDTTNFQSHDFNKPTHLRLGEPPTTIDIINETVGIDYKSAFKRAHEVTIDNILIHVIHINDLIQNKKALNTFKDLADAEQLEKIVLKK